MLHRSLSEKAAACFYGDERLAAKLWQTLLQPPRGIAEEGWVNLQNECYHLLVESVDARYPREHRLGDIRLLMDQLCDGDFLLSSGLPWLDELAAQLLQRNGDLLCYRETSVQAYVRLAAELDPAMLVAWNLSIWLQESPKPAAHDIRRVVSAQTAFFAPPGNPLLPFAEGHVHFWGITADSVILDNYLFGGQALVSGHKSATWGREQLQALQSLLERARKLLVLLLDRSELPIDSKQYAVQDRGEIQQRLINPVFDGKTLPDWSLLAEVHASDEVGTGNWLLGEFAGAMAHGLPNRWLWLHIFLCRRYQTTKTPPEERAAILCWWQTINALRRSLIMDGQGLTRFAERYYGTPLGRGTERATSDILGRLFAGKNDLAEFKGSTAAFSAEEIGKLAPLLAVQAKINFPKPAYIFGENEIQLDSKALSYLQALERWQFCAHFSRSVTHKRGARAKFNNKSKWDEAEKLLKTLNQHSGWNLPEFLGGKLNSNFNFQPARWLRGLDVAGDENCLKIEWFSPILRWLREGFMTRPDGERASTGFHLSIHAGEDYSHPASGMRHIDETVRFCDMRDGDRLGHALAIGIDPATWAKRQGEMLLPLDEHLDNLVWLWHYATVLSAKLPLAQQILPTLERRIFRFIQDYDWQDSAKFWDEGGNGIDHVGNKKLSEKSNVSNKNITSKTVKYISPNVLHQAWLLRRNCHYRWQLLQGCMPLNSQERTALPDWEKISDEADQAGQLFLSRHSHLANGNEPPLVRVRAGSQSQAEDCNDKQSMPRYQHLGKMKTEMLEDIETPAELEFMHALQDHLLDKYDRIGLIIETNPTSNVYIARLRQHSEHPIFRWSPPDESVLEKGAEANRYNLRRGPVRVLVNTDDPGIMPTTLRTEFLLLREAAIERGVSRTIAERWLEKLRQYGIEQFHRNHLQIFEPI